MTASIFSPVFVIGQIRIGSVEGASAVNFGNNSQEGFTSHKKHNQGFGEVGGDHNKVEGLKTLLDDKDLLDMFNDGHESGEELARWFRKLDGETTEK